MLFYKTCQPFWAPGLPQFLYVLEFLLFNLQFAVNVVGSLLVVFFCSRSNGNTVVWHLKLSDFLSDRTIRFISYFLILCYLCLLFDIMLIVLISGVFYLKLYCLGMVKNVRKKLQYNFKRWLLLKGEQFSRF